MKWWLKKKYLYVYPILTLIFIMVVLHALHYPSHKHKVQRIIKQKPLRVKAKPDEINLILVFCQDIGDRRKKKAPTTADIAKDWKRQMRQLKVLVKTAVLFSKRPLHFILVTETQKVFDRLVTVTDGWPEQYTENIRMSRTQVYYPRGSEAMKQMFRTCATQRLFLTDMFPTIDSAIFLDTDFLFLRPLEDLWDHFKFFRKDTLLAMSPCLFHYKDQSNGIPYYGETGLNAGLMLMNITRMRASSVNLTQAFTDISKQYKHNIKLADQDILNIFFSKHPELMMELGCDWNVRHLLCRIHPYPCNRPISFIHGNAMSFVGENSYKVRTVFETIEDWDLDHENMEDLPERMWTALKQVDAKNLPDICRQVRNYDNMILHYLYKNLAPNSLLPKHTADSNMELQ